VSDTRTPYSHRALPSPPPRCDWRGGASAAWCFSSADYVVLTIDGTMVGFACETHLAAILASLHVPAQAMLYWDWLGTRSIPQS
jgi:hypothetical protein